MTTETQSNEPPKSGLSTVLWTVIPALFLAAAIAGLFYLTK